MLTIRICPFTEYTSENEILRKRLILMEIIGTINMNENKREYRNKDDVKFSNP